MRAQRICNSLSGRLKNETYTYCYIASLLNLESTLCALLAQEFAKAQEEAIPLNMACRFIMNSPTSSKSPQVQSKGFPSELASNAA